MKNLIKLLKTNEEKLIKEKEEISVELTKIEKEAQEVSSDVLTDAEMESKVGDLFDRAQLMARETNLKKTLIDVKQALFRIKKNNYGICQNCKKPISPERLVAFPAAKYCINCAATIEEKEAINEQAG